MIRMNSTRNSKHRHVVIILKVLQILNGPRSPGSMHLLLRFSLFLCLFFRLLCCSFSRLAQESPNTGAFAELVGTPDKPGNERFFKHSSAACRRGNRCEIHWTAAAPKRGMSSDCFRTYKLTVASLRLSKSQHGHPKHKLSLL